MGNETMKLWGVSVSYFTGKIEAYLRSIVSPPPPSDAPVRAAILQLTTAYGARIAMGETEDTVRLWGSEQQMLEMTVRVLRAALMG